MPLLRRLVCRLLFGGFRLPRDLVRWTCRRHRNRCAIATGGGDRLSYGELGRRVVSLAAGLRRKGLAPGERVAFLLPDGTPFVELRLACYEAGLIAVPLVRGLGQEALANALETCAPRLFLYDPALANETGIPPLPPDASARPLDGCDPNALADFRNRSDSWQAPPIDPSKPAAINFTSGTTGTPKGVTSSHAAWCESVKMLIRESGGRPKPGESILHAVPLATAGWGVLLPHLFAGVTNALCPDFDAEAALRRIETEGISRMFLTPSQLTDLLDAPRLSARNLGGLSRIFCGTAPLYGEKLREARERFGPIVQGGYGMAEVLPPVALWDAAAHSPERPMRAGRLAAGVRVRIAGEDGRPLSAGERGEIQIQSPTRMLGYWQDEERTRHALEDGFFRTGDLGYFDGEGILNVLGRISDMLPGEEAHPRETEERAHACPGVKECALILENGGPVLVYSERSACTVDEDTLRQILSESGMRRMPALRKTDGDLPRSAAGKVVRSEIG